MVRSSVADLFGSILLSDLLFDKPEPSQSFFFFSVDQKIHAPLLLVAMDDNESICSSGFLTIAEFLCACTQNPAVWLEVVQMDVPRM